VGFVALLAAILAQALHLSRRWGVLLGVPMVFLYAGINRFYAISNQSGGDVCGRGLGLFLLGRPESFYRLVYGSFRHIIVAAGYAF
jgi:hypothetical protein